MDFGIRDKWAIVCASTKGLGFGCANALAEEGVNLVINGRGKESLVSSGNEIRTRFGVEVIEIQGDVTTEEGRSSLFEACPKPDIVVNNAAGPRAGMWTDWDRADFIAAFDSNLLAPIEMMKTALPGMIDKGWGRVVNITSQSVKAPIPVLGLSNTARAGLTGYVAGTSRQVAQYGVTINNLLPGIHATDRSVYLDTETAKNTGITREEAEEQRKKTIPSRRYGQIEEFGAACAFLCSQQASFIVGQNLLLDGGAVNATI
ncbi:MAG: SDR family oxidoreductase [Rhodobacteraceae bacterium]|nr:SDR family oxidoreductase [Paracoccaceae bacterium]MCY4250898.1 SDR family oxidoreductase [Paracoccaceae bacterium]MCY4307069.1 SDR family oxidoreductase [Paracoccaceae bacterium]